MKIPVDDVVTDEVVHIERSPEGFNPLDQRSSALGVIPKGCMLAVAVPTGVSVMMRFIGQRMGSWGSASPSRRAYRPTRLKAEPLREGDGLPSEQSSIRRRVPLHNDGLAVWREELVGARLAAGERPEMAELASRDLREN
ncbi:MAG: hypothetical protein ACRDYY_14730 [Acidimicrobiales bacterium]